MRGCQRNDSLFFMERYRNFASYLKETFGSRVQKISINAGFTCPNRDGTKGWGGCIYCDNAAFSPDFTSSSHSIFEQIEKGIQYFAKKYPTQLYIAYFQNYTNTYARIDVLKDLYFKALSHPKVVGLAISTRPDCINTEVLELLCEINKQKKVFIELGLESTDNDTLYLLNRCHTFEDYEKAAILINQYQLWNTTHIIMGLPGETIDNALKNAKILSTLPINSIKLHQFQVLKGTILEKWYLSNKINLNPLTIEDYINWVIVFLEHLHPDFYIERFTSESPLDRVVAPNWNGLKNYHMVEMIRKRMKELNTYQGIKFKKN